MTKVQVEYKFIFDPSETWSSLSEFNASFSAYLKSIGLQAERVRVGSEEDSEEFEEMLIISPIPDMVAEATKPKSTKSQRFLMNKKIEGV